MRVTQVQLDELFALLSAVKAGEVSEAEALTRLSRSPHWVWTAMDPVTKLLLTIDIGDRTLAMAQCVVHQVVQVLAPDCVPLFLTDGFKEYATALLTHYAASGCSRPASEHKGQRPSRAGCRCPTAVCTGGQDGAAAMSGPRAASRGVRHPGDRQCRCWLTLGCQINTAFIERLNLTIRQHVAAVGRRVTTLCKGEDGIQQQLALYHVYYNFCLPHASLRQPLLQPEPTHGTGSAKRWQPRTPAMAAGLTDHVWTLREVLCLGVRGWSEWGGR